MGRYAPPEISVEEMQRRLDAGPKEFRDCARQLIGCYAYTLGYRDSRDHLLRGLYFEPNDHLPIMGDRPPFEQTDYRSVRGMKNSPNHSDAGQNVLFLSGRVNFCKDRTVGVGGNDIYLNKNGLPEAGVDRSDSVLGASDFCPSLPQVNGH
jgi:hypothetical protein